MIHRQPLRQRRRHQQQLTTITRNEISSHPGFLLFWLGALYWIETLFAQSVRRPPASPRQGTAGTELLRPSADAAIIYIYSLGLVQLIAYVLLYLIK